MGLSALVDTLVVVFGTALALWTLVPGVVSSDEGLLSVYRPGDGMNSGELACGGEFTTSQRHLARRDWRRLGCGRVVLVHATDTGRWAVAPVRDAGPFGVIYGKLRGAKAQGRWKVHTGHRPPRGWRWRAVADLSWALWLELGKPRGLSTIKLYFLPMFDGACRRDAWALPTS